MVLEACFQLNEYVKSSQNRPLSTSPTSPEPVTTSLPLLKSNTYLPVDAGTVLLLNVVDVAVVTDKAGIPHHLELAPCSRLTSCRIQEKLFPPFSHFEAVLKSDLENLERIEYLYRQCY